MEFLVEINAMWPAEGDPGKRDTLISAEAMRAQELAQQGILKKLWRIPGTWSNVGIWEAADATALHAALSSLPFFRGFRSLSGRLRRTPTIPTEGADAVGSIGRRRSCLVVPGGSEKMMAKSLTLEADEIVFDLEDAIAPDAKSDARTLVVDVIRSNRLAERQLAVRINAAGTTWHDADMAALGSLEQRFTLVVPKVDSPTDLRQVSDRLEQAGSMVGLQALIETASGLANCVSIAASSARLEAMIIGYADLASSLGRSAGAGWAYAQESVLVAARAANLEALDGPSFDLSNETSLAKDAQATAQLGFDGKWAIHPSQIETINMAYTPSSDAVARAQGTLDALNVSRETGRGVALFQGAMVDEAMRLGALRTLRRAGFAP